MKKVIYIIIMLIPCLGEAKEFNNDTIQGYVVYGIDNEELNARITNLKNYQQNKKPCKLEAFLRYKFFYFIPDSLSINKGIRNVLNQLEPNVYKFSLKQNSYSVIDNAIKSIYKIKGINNYKFIIFYVKCVAEKKMIEKSNVIFTSNDGPYYFPSNKSVINSDDKYNLYIINEIIDVNFYPMLLKDGLIFYDFLPTAP